MQRIKKLKSKSELETATVYTYIVEDDFGNIQEITDLNEYQPGDRVEVWFKEQYNKPGMRKWKEKRLNDN